MRLDQAFDSIMGAVKDALEADAESLISDVNEIVRGDRARGKPESPAIWIFGETANIDHTVTSLQERWSLPVVLVAIYQQTDNDTEEEAYMQASSLAARARSVIFKSDRTLGLRSLVQDTRSSRFEPSAPWHRDGKLFAAAAVIDVIFRILE